MASINAPAQPTGHLDAMLASVGSLADQAGSLYLDLLVKADRVLGCQPTAETPAGVGENAPTPASLVEAFWQQLNRLQDNIELLRAQVRRVESL